MLQCKDLISQKDSEPSNKKEIISKINHPLKIRIKRSKKMNHSLLMPQSIHKSSVSPSSFIQDVFVIGMVTPFKKELLVDFRGLLTMACKLGFNFLISLSGERECQEVIIELSEEFPSNIEIFEPNSKSTTEILKQSQVILFLETPEISALKIVLQKGLIPIMPHNEMLENFNAVKESGEAFCYKKSEPMEAFAILIRAYENHKFPYDWNQIKKRMKKKLINL